MSRTLAGTDLTPSAVHAVVEIGAAGRLSAKDLSAKLLLEKSTVSRLVKSLEDKGVVRVVRSEEDTRIKHLYLTGRGERSLVAIDRFAEHQVTAAIAFLNDTSRQRILRGLQTYSAALKASRTSSDFVVNDEKFFIEEGYTPRIIGRIVEMHASYYSRAVGFGAAFETKVATEFADFMARLGNRRNSIWYAEKGGEIVGGIAIDGESLGDGRAHLRWFIVDDGFRGAGIGKALIRKALDFSDKRNFRETQLWTFKELEAARKLYEGQGFSLVDEYPGDQWGTEIQEQHLARPRPD